MITHTATRRIQFCAGHRVYEHGSKCRNLHGHNYVALITAQAKALDDLGMVIDFGVLKEKIGAWIDTHWDHGFIYFAGDPGVEAAINAFDIMEGGDRFRQKWYALPRNPTAENMAAYLLKKGNELLTPYGVRVTEVTLWETENCYATVVDTWEV